MKTVKEYLDDMPGGLRHPKWSEVEDVLNEAIKDALEAAASHIEKRRDKGDCPPRAHFCENYGCGTLTELAVDIRSGKL